MLLFLTVSCCAAIQQPAWLPTPEHRHLAVPSGEQLDYLRFPAAGKRLLIWVPSERGQAEAEQSAASELAQRGVEVWMLDLNFSYLLDFSRKELDQVPAADMQALFRHAGRGKRLVIFAVGRAAVPMLKAYGSWERSEGRTDHFDFVLMHPNLYAEADALQDARYVDFGNLHGARLRIMQPRRTAGVVWLDQQRNALQAQGAEVRNEILEKLREGFWEREEATAYETEMGQHLADLIWDRLPTEDQQ